MSTQALQTKQLDDIGQNLAEIENTQKLSNMLMKTPHYAKLGSEGIFALVSFAKSIDMNPLEALNGGLYYVKGKVGMSTETMVARMRKAGHSIVKDPKSNDQMCILHGKRGDNGDTWMTSFSIADAKRAGIYNESSTWGKYPDVMCYNRAASKMYRQLTPELSRNAGYTFDELKEIAGVSSSPLEMSSVEVIKNETITSDQLFELREILNECDPAYEGQILSHLKKSSANIDALDQVPMNLYDRIKSAAIKKAEEFQKTLKSHLDNALEYEEVNA